VNHPIYRDKTMSRHLKIMRENFVEPKGQAVEVSPLIPVDSPADALRVAVCRRVEEEGHFHIDALSFSGGVEYFASNSISTLSPPLLTNNIAAATIRVEDMLFEYSFHDDALHLTYGSGQVSSLVIKKGEKVGEPLELLNSKNRVGNFSLALCVLHYLSLHKDNPFRVSAASISFRQGNNGNKVPVHKTKIVTIHTDKC